jgi:hypothetical protein
MIAALDVSLRDQCSDLPPVAVRFDLRPTVTSRLSPRSRHATIFDLTTALHRT